MYMDCGAKGGDGVKYGERLAALAWYAAVAVLVWAGVRYALVWLLPFLLALGLAMLLEPMMEQARRRLRLKRGFTAAVVTLVLVGGLLAALIAVLVQAVEQALALLASLPEMLAGLPEALERVQARVSDFCAACPEGLRRWAEGALADLPQLASSLAGQASSTALRGLSSLMAALPGLFLACGTTVLAVFFTLTAYPQVMAFLRRQLPARWRGRAGGVKASVLDTLGKWLRAECILLLVTFLQLLAGLLLLRQEYALLLALLIALIDALPVFGTGTVLLPWAAVLCVAGDVPRGIALAALIITVVDALPVFGTGTILIPWALVLFLRGQTKTGVGLVVLYGAAALSRQTLEPRLVGKQVGLNPVLTLLALYTGYRLLSVGGMIVFPITAMLLKQIWDHSGLQPEG